MPTKNQQEGHARRWREKVTFLTSLSMVGVVFLVCLAVLLLGHASAEEQRWVQSVLTFILGAATRATFKR